MFLLNNINFTDFCYFILHLLILQIQQLFSLMESSTVKGAIDALIQARPGSSAPAPTSGGGASKDEASAKRATMKRRSNAGGGLKCNCGKCTRCLPSPSGESTAPYVCTLYI